MISVRSDRNVGSRALAPDVHDDGVSVVGLVADDIRAMSHNTWMHRAVRPVARSLARTRVTPNQVNTLRLVAGLAAAAFAEGSETWRAGTFLLGMFLDRADGELARLSGKISPRGHTYDWSAMRFLTRLRS